MQDQRKQPPSIWLTQAFLLLGAVQCAIAMIRDVLFCISNNATQSCLGLSMVLSLVSVLIVLFLFLVTFWGIQKRKSYAKWWAVGLLMVAVIVDISLSHYLQLALSSMVSGNSLPTPPYDCWQSDNFTNFERYCGYSSYWDLAKQGLLELLLPMLLGGLGARLIFSRAVKRFFQPAKM